MGYVEDLTCQEIFLCVLRKNGSLDSPLEEFVVPTPSLRSFAAAIISLALSVGRQRRLISRLPTSTLQSARLSTSQVSNDLFAAYTFQAWATTGRLPLGV